MSPCRRCKWRPRHSYTGKRGLCLKCVVVVDEELAGKRKRICTSCKTRVRDGGGHLCKRCRQAEQCPDVPMPKDFEAKVTQLRDRVDPLAIPMKCWCGKETHPEMRYVVALLESRCIEVCSEGHATLMRLHGTHTYDQRQRAEEEAARQEAINLATAETKRRNGTENPRSRRCGER